MTIKIAYSFSGTAHALSNGGRDTFAGEELTATVQCFDWDKHATVYWKKKRGFTSFASYLWPFKIPLYLRFRLRVFR